MNSNRLDKFRSYSLPDMDYLLLTGGIGCGRANAIMAAYCNAGHPQCNAYCGFNLQCTDDYTGGSSYISLNPC